MSLRDKLFGRPLASWEGRQEELSVATGVPVLGLDALASTGYGPEAALTLLLPLGEGGLYYFKFVIFLVLFQLLTLYFSYQQTAEAYPGGGGAYIVVKENLNVRFGVWAAVALLIDYLLNVAVAIAAGVGALVSAFPILHPYTLGLCLIVLATLTFLNLRGIRESGLAFIAPVVVFILCMAVVLGLGIVDILQSGGQPIPAAAPPAIPTAKTDVSLWVLLGAFANGCTAMTGIEAVSNGVPLFKEPKVRNAKRTLTAIMVVLSLFLVAIAFLCPAYQIGAMNQQDPGYQTILSQIVAAVVGRGTFYFIALGSIFIVLTYSAQTSFTDFPRVCRLLAEDLFLPPIYANRGRRLVYSAGIITLATISGILLIVFNGITHKLIPLFAVGAFGAFLFSQWGMVRHWLSHRTPGSHRKLIFNGVGAVMTSIALVIILVAKFVEGAWVTFLLVPFLVFTLWGIRHHYLKIKHQVGVPAALRCGNQKKPVVVVPINGWNGLSEKALRFALLLSDDVTAVHICPEGSDPEKLKEIWAVRVEAPAKSAETPIPRLQILSSPYRLLYDPLLNFIDEIKKKKPDTFVAVLIPQLMEPHWYEHVLHNQHGIGLMRRLFQKRDVHTVVISIPWYFNEE